MSIMVQLSEVRSKHFLSHSGYIGYALILRLLLAMKVSEQSHAGVMNNEHISSIVKASTKVTKFQFKEDVDW